MLRKFQWPKFLALFKTADDGQRKREMSVLETYPNFSVRKWHLMESSANENCEFGEREPCPMVEIKVWPGRTHKSMPEGIVNLTALVDTCWECLLQHKTQLA